MEQVPMNDGLDGRETLAFGLGAAEVAAFVLALLAAYATLRSGFPGVVAWPLAGLLAGGGALLAWGRVEGRSMLGWAILLGRFLVRTAPARAAGSRRRLQTWQAALRARLADARLDVHRAPASGQAGGLVIPLALRPVPATTASQPPRAGHLVPCHVVGFFSLAGGTGRTTLAVEVATILAVRGCARAATGDRAMRVALLDLAGRNPCVGLRLGLPPPCGPADALTVHRSGLLVGIARPSAVPTSTAAAFPAALLAGSKVDVAVVDFDCDLGALCHDVVARCDQLLVTMTPTAGGVVDAYRSTALLRRLGARERIGHVVNRWRPGLDLGEMMADLGAEVVAEIPDDDCFADSENRHSLAGLDGDGEGDVAAALERLATHIERQAGAASGARGGAVHSSHAG